MGGLYVVVEVGGSGIVVAPGILYDPGDWVLCVSESVGWMKIDVVGGGGGGGVNRRSELLDVNIPIPPGPSEGDLLVFGSDALWNATDVLNGGTY